MLKRWEKLSSKLVHENPWWTYMLDRFHIPDGIDGEYHYVHTPGSSMVIPVTDDGKIILVNQFRFLCDKESIEFPCGGVRKGESHASMAAIELEEETGYRAEEIRKCGEFNPFNGVTDEMCHVFIARSLIKTQSRPDVTEEFELLYCSPDEIDSMIASNRIWDGMTLAAWSLGKNKL